MNFFKRLFSFGKKPAKDLDKNEIDDLKDEKDEESIQKDSVKEEVKQTRSKPEPEPEPEARSQRT